MNRRILLSLGLAGTLGLGGCKDAFDIPNTNSPTAEALAGRLALARTATGILFQANNDLAGQIQQWGIYGRELYNLNGNDPRETGEEISGPQAPEGRAGGLWSGKYQAIRTLNAYLAAVEAAGDLTDAEKSASRGFAKTFLGWHFYRLAVREGPLGAPIDVDRPIDAEPAPFVSTEEVFAHAASLLDEAVTDLNAGGSAFPFTFGPGYTGFDNPTTFIKVNRALAAKLQVDRGWLTSCGATCFQDALTALGQSFITTVGLPASLATGVYFAYDLAAGEQRNPVSENLTANRYWVHPSLEALVQDQLNGDPDLRWTNKVRRVPAARDVNGYISDLKPIMYNTNTPTTSVADLGADIPFIINEELLLIRAEANIGLGNLQPAIDDIDLVRIHAGGLGPSGLTAASPIDAVISELTYNRLFSLLFQQGTRWVDARKYGRIDQLPLDHPGDVVHLHMLIPAGECDARNLSVPCTPLNQ